MRTHSKPSRTRTDKLKKWARAAFLAGVAGFASLSAIANDVLYTGGATVNGTGDFSPTFILAAPGLTENVTINLNTQALTGPAVDSVRVIGFAGNVNLNVDAGFGISGGTNSGAFITTTTGNVTAVINDNVTSAIHGVAINSKFAPDTGDISVTGTGSLGSGSNTGAGAWLVTDTGNVTMDGFSSIQGGSNGILIDSNGTWAGNPGGDVNLGTTTALGPITARAGTGIYVAQQANAFGDGDVNIVTNDVTANGGHGVQVHGWTGDTNIVTKGDVVATGAVARGIYAWSTSGNITADGDGTGTIDSGDDGIEMNATWAVPGGVVTVKDYVSITGADTGLWLLTDNAGESNINGIGTLTGTARWGALINGPGYGGDINIGTTAANGEITGGLSGIVAYTANDANINITDDVTGTAQWGIFAAGINGDLNINVNSGNVTGGLRGIEARTDAGTGDVNVNVAAGSTVQGTEYGLITGTATGLATTNNAGIVRDTADTGAASDAGGDAIWAFAGNNVVNNTGEIIGRVHSGSTSFDLNNQAGGVWTPGTGENLFLGADDSVNNAGTINIRSGTTTFRSLANLNNQAGGHIDLSHGPDATDNLVVLNFNPEAGSAITVNFDASAANNAALGFDNSDDGKGTADTIVVVGDATPAAASTVNLVNAGGAPTSLAGSVALVYTGVNKVAPKPGDNIVGSTLYTFGTGDQTNAATKFYLVDDGNGGVYLQWAPNLTPTSTGGFLGGSLSGAAATGPSGFGGGTDGGGAVAGSGMATTVGQLGSAVGGVGGFGGPNGGGVFGRIGDAAAMYNACDSACDCDCDLGHNYWFLSNATVANFNDVGGGNSYGFAVGAERQVRNTSGFDSFAVGAFAQAGSADFQWNSGNIYTISYGGGVYLRGTTSEGYYGTMMGALTGVDNDLQNNVFQSHANQNGLGYVVGGAVGRVVPVTNATSLDFRLFSTYGSVNGHRFTDSNGLVVDGTQSGIVTVGAMTGVQHRISTDTMVYARGGVKWFSLDRQLTVGDTTVKGEVNSLVGSFGGGLAKALTQNASIDLFGYGDIGNRFQAGGGMITLVISR